jgi:hypothetical protein
MTALEIYAEAAKRGLRLEPAGERLAVFPKGQCPPEFAETLRQHKAELLDWLNRTLCPGWQALPPENLPLNPNMPRPGPHYRERVIAYMLRQVCDQPSPLTAWLMRRECDYYDGPGRHWDCALHAYAAARDAACWQLNRDERVVWNLLDSTAESLLIWLRSINHPDCRRAIERLKDHSRRGAAE